MKKVNSPSPLAPRICACGCGHEFQPTRKDKVYLNNDHAQFGYNHGKRKERDGNSTVLNKLIRKNDNILRFFYEQKNSKNDLVRLSSLKDAGFNSGIKPGKTRSGDDTFYLMSNFKYKLIRQEEEWFVQIRKMSKIV